MAGGKNEKTRPGPQRGAGVPGTRYRLLSGTSAYPSASFGWQLPQNETPLVVLVEEENSSGRQPGAQR